MVFLTSLVPAGQRFREAQHEAVRSWQRNGVTVVSLNYSAEHDLLVSENGYDGVCYMPVERREESDPRVRVSDILAFARRCFPSETVGFINSDIVLDERPEVLEKLSEYAKRGLVYVSRYNRVFNGGFFLRERMEEYGIDFFVIDVKMMPEIKPTPFRVGAPVWDYWLPWIYHVEKRELYHYKRPFSFHVAHALNWNEKEWNDMADEFLRYFSIPRDEKFNRNLYMDAIGRFLKQAPEIDD